MLRDYLKSADFDELLALAAKFDPDQLADAFQDDPLMANCLGLLAEFAASPERDDPVLINFQRNNWEFATRQTVLKSYPWDVALPIAHSCNAKCLFCDSWMHSKGLLEPAHLERLAPVIRYARYLGLQGHGEPLINPHLEELLAMIGRMRHPKCIVYIITNGRLLPRYRQILLDAGVVGFHVSLNAATPEVHDRMMSMGSGAFDIIVSEIKKLVAWRDAHDRRVAINLSMVVTAENIEDAPAFVRLGSELRANRLYFKTLNPTRATAGEGPLAYAKLPPYLHPSFQRLVEETRLAVASSKVQVEVSFDDWNHPVFLPEFEERLRKGERFNALSRAEAMARYGTDKEPVPHLSFGLRTGSALTDGPNPENRQPPFPCYFPYQTLNIFGCDFTMSPCCFMGSSVPGHEEVAWDGSQDFFTFWNAPAFVELRRSLALGPLFDPCKVCPTLGSR
ncbi:MAG: radical SAM protein [Alphaproteobacteria bacterium]|nr:radical SAM protein [Alphaproteobacteria bacterium]